MSNIIATRTAYFKLEIVLTVFQLPTGARVMELRYGTTVDEIFDVRIIPCLKRSVPHFPLSLQRCVPEENRVAIYIANERVQVPVVIYVRKTG